MKEIDPSLFLPGATMDSRIAKTLPFKLFCPICWRTREVTISDNGPHVQADCKKCKSYIKFLNKKEVKRVLLLGIYNAN